MLFEEKNRPKQISKIGKTNNRLEDTNRTRVYSPSDQSKHPRQIFKVRADQQLVHKNKPKDSNTAGQRYASHNSPSDQAEPLESTDVVDENRTENK